MHFCIFVETQKYESFKLTVIDISLGVTLGKWGSKVTNRNLHFCISAEMQKCKDLKNTKIQMFKFLYFSQKMKCLYWCGDYMQHVVLESTTKGPPMAWSVSVSELCPMVTGHGHHQHMPYPRQGVGEGFL